MNTGLWFEKRFGSGADPGLHVRVTHLNKSRRAEGGSNIFGVFRVKNNDFTPKNHIFSNFRGRALGAPLPLDPPLRLRWCSTGILKRLYTMRYIITGSTLVCSVVSATSCCSMAVTLLVRWLSPVENLAARRCTASTLLMLSFCWDSLYNYSGCIF